MKYLLLCRECNPYGTPLVFDTEQERMDYALAHKGETLHDRWGVGEAYIEVDESEVAEAELLCFKSDQCILLYEHEGKCKFKGNIPNNFGPSASQQTNREEPQRFSDEPFIRFAQPSRPSPATERANRLMADIFTNAMNAGVNSATISFDNYGVNLNVRPGWAGGRITHEEIDGHEGEISP